MKFGIEQELFILKKDKNTLSYNEQLSFFSNFEHCGYEIEANNHIRIATLQSEDMEVEISNDFCTHIFELMFSPMENIGVFEKFYDRVVKDLKLLCKSMDLEIVDYSVLDLTSNVFPVVSQSDKNGLRMQKLINRRINDHFMFDKNIMSSIVSTQIHLDWDFTTFPNLKNLYNFEYLFPLLYSNSKTFKEMEYACVRPLLYKENFTTYNLVAFPEKIPNSFFELKENSNTANFIRDYSFISLRPDLNTIEFRGNCSHISMDIIKEILVLRIAILKTSNLNIQHLKSLRKDYYDTCLSGEYNKRKLFQDFKILSNIEIAEQDKSIFDDVLKKINHLL